MHKGQELHKCFKRSGYSLSAIAKKLNISRNTLYKHLKCQNPSADFILELESKLKWNLSFLFPSINRPRHAERIHAIRQFEKAYAEVAEKLIALLHFALEFALTIECPELKKEMMAFVKDKLKGKERPPHFIK